MTAASPAASSAALLPAGSLSAGVALCNGTVYTDDFCPSVTVAVVLLGDVRNSSHDHLDSYCSIVKVRCENDVIIIRKHQCGPVRSKVLSSNDNHTS